MARFQIIKEFDTLAGNSQGLCLDETYVYISEGQELMKYTRDGTFVARHDATPDGPNHHLGDCMVMNGIIYVTSSDYPDTPYNEIVMEYNASDLSYRGIYYPTFTDHVGEGIDYRDGKFWTISDNFDECYRWEAGFTNPATFPLGGPEITGSGHHFQTIVWVGDYMYTQLHGGVSPAYPLTVFKYYFDGARFIFIEELDRPNHEAGQGMSWDVWTNTMWFATRANGDNPDTVIQSKIVDLPMFDSNDPIDKIVDEGEVVIVNNGVTTISTVAKIVTSNTPNGYGIEALCRARWSIDGGTSWQALETTLVYGFEDNYSGTFGTFTDKLKGLKAAISVGSDSARIYFRTANGFHGSVTSNDVGSTYTPTSLTFVIQYKVYEKE